MMDIGIYQVQRDNDGIYVVTEQLTATEKSFVILDEAIEYISINLRLVVGNL